MFDFAFARTIGIPDGTMVTVDTSNPCGPGSLREAVQLANYSPAINSIVIDPSLSGQTIHLNHEDGPVIIADDLTIDGSSLASPLTISGDSDGDLLGTTTDRTTIFSVQEGSDVTFESLIIRDGLQTSTGIEGGGLFNRGTSTLRSCQFIANHTDARGGAVVNRGTLRVEGSNFQSNSSGDWGGAIYNTSEGTLTIINSSFHSNQAGTTAGAIRCTGTSSGGTLELLAINCSFTNNYAGSAGGAVYLSSANTKWQNCTFYENESESGGGGCFYSNQSFTELDNCTLVSNLTDGPGGAIRNINSSNAHLRNTILWSNSASGSTSSTSASVANANNNTGSTYNHCLIDNSGGSLAWQGALGFDLGGNLDTDPLLAPPGLYGGTTTTLPPDTGAPAIPPVIDAGSAALLPPDVEDLDRDSNTSEALPVDQRGFVRIDETLVDIGAVETQPNLISTTNDSGPGSLRNALDSAIPGSTITFDPGTFGDGGTITLTSGVVTIDRDLTVDASTLPGADDPDTKVTISGNNSTRLLLISGGAQALIDSVDFVDGSNDNGGGIVVGGSGAQLTLRNARVANNQATASSGDGGGVAVSGSFIAENCLFENNTAVDGGGALRIYSSGDATLSNCSFVGNQAKRGADAYVQKNLDAVHCTLVDNTSTIEGGALYTLNSGTAVTLTNRILRAERPWEQRVTPKNASVR